MQKYKVLLDKCIGIYLVFNIVYNLFGWVVPIKEVTPEALDSAVYAVMGILGALLVLADVILNRYWLKTKYCWLLYAFLCVMGISSILNLSFGFMSNAKTIMWSLIQFTIFYSYCQRVEKEKLIRYTSRLCVGIAAFWLVPTLYSMLQFLRLNSYYTPIWGKKIKQGLVENRLFGVFNDPNYAAFMSLILIIGMYFLYQQTKKQWKKNVCIIYGLIQFLYIVLSGSRTVEVGMLCTVLLFVYLQLRNKYPELKGVKVILNRCFLAFLCVVFIFVFWEGTRTVAEQVPAGLNKIEWFQEYAKESQKKLDNKKEKVESKMKSTKKSKKVLQRKDGKAGNVSNNRVTIWKSYLGGMQNHYIFGMSPRNSVKVFVTENPKSYIGQTEYETHNGYLSVFVCTGVAGSLLMIIFLALQGKRIFGIIIHKKVISSEHMCCLFVIMNISIFAFFFTDLFFVNNIVATLFWTLLGLSNHWSVENDEIS